MIIIIDIYVRINDMSQNNLYTVSSAETVSTSGSASKYWDWLQSPHDQKVPHEWDNISPYDQVKLLRILLVWPELCQHYRISMLSNKRILGLIRDDIFRGRTDMNYLHKSVKMEEHFLRDWWQTTLLPASRWKLWTLAHMDADKLRVLKL